MGVGESEERCPASHAEPLAPGPLRRAAYGIDSFTEMLDLRHILQPQVESDEEADEGGVGGNGEGDAEGSAEGSAAGGATCGAAGGAAGGAAADSAVRAAAALAEAREGGGLALPRAALRACAPRTARFLARFRALNEALVEVVEDFSLVSFVPASASDPASLRAVLAAADKAGGWVMTSAAARLGASRA